LLGTLWIWMAGIILSEAIGRTNWSPLSGMTLVGITLLIIVTQAFGMERSDSIIAAIMVGAAMCVAMSQATDLMLDLKTGYLVGATPRMQQIGQFAGAWLGPIVVIFVIFALNEAYTLGSERLPAPQAQALLRGLFLAESCRRLWAVSGLRSASVSTCRSTSFSRIRWEPWVVKLRNGPGAKPGRSRSVSRSQPVLSSVKRSSVSVTRYVTC
jgi:hypothetical protein